MTEQEKKARARRLAQNKGVKAGTVRTGAGGKYLRKYNATTGRWEKIGAAKGSGYGRRTSISASQASKAESRRSKPVTLTGGQKPSGGTNAKPKKMAVEGPKVSRPRSTDWYSQIGGRVQRTTYRNRPSDFPKGARLQVVKERNKDAEGRNVYRYVQVSSKKKK